MASTVLPLLPLSGKAQRIGSLCCPQVSLPETGAFPNFCKLFVPARTARNVNVVSRPYGTKNPGI